MPLVLLANTDLWTSCNSIVCLCELFFWAPNVLHLWELGICGDKDWLHACFEVYMNETTCGVLDVKKVKTLNEKLADLSACLFVSFGIVLLLLKSDNLLVKGARAACCLKF